MHKCAHPLTYTLLKHLLLVIQHSVCLSKILPTSHILIWQLIFTLSGKNARDLSNGETISCAQIFMGMVSFGWWACFCPKGSTLVSPDLNTFCYIVLGDLGLKGFFFHENENLIDSPSTPNYPRCYTPDMWRMQKMQGVPDIPAVLLM